MVLPLSTYKSGPPKIVAVGTAGERERSKVSRIQNTVIVVYVILSGFRGVCIGCRSEEHSPSQHARTAAGSINCHF